MISERYFTTSLAFSLFTMMPLFDSCTIFCALLIMSALTMIVFQLFMFLLVYASWYRTPSSSVFLICRTTSSGCLMTLTITPCLSR